MSRDTFARIDLDALAHNLGVVRKLTGKSRVACVIKADGYGHGITRVASALSETDLFAVATPDEARAVRGAGWSGPLLLLEGFSDAEDLSLARELRLELVVHRPGQLQALEESGLVSGQRLWLKLDTGMHRLGFPAADAPALIPRAMAVAGGAHPVLMTHFACADELQNPMTAAQVDLFDSATAGLDLDRSLANSAAIINFPGTCREIVRPGIMLYGISPIAGTTGLDFGLRPVMSLHAELIAINHCHAGDRIGYGSAFTCPRDMRVGVVAIGYGDGYPRRLENGAPVLLNGRRTALAGRVSMDMITIDLGGHEQARVGDIVTLWGEGLPVEEVADTAGAIPYELVCGLTGRVDRVTR
ncbi:MAG: alanine racemase [Xanthomonadales bacterium]|nr:alanine racemase [Xanthomonadales bacterium]